MKPNCVKICMDEYGIRYLDVIEPHPTDDVIQAATQDPNMYEIWMLDMEGVFKQIL